MGPIEYPQALGSGSGRKDFCKYMHKIEQAINQVTTRIEKAALAAGRNPRGITLLAVSKRQPETSVRAAYDAGLRHFGENYVQEALEKIQNLALPQAVWHFIGPIQSNKTRALAERFDWVHSLDREKIAQRLNDQRDENSKPLNVCIQVNIDNESSKSGCTPEQASELAQQIVQLPRLALRGLMAIPSASEANAPEPNAFTRMRDLFLHLQKQPGLASMDTLSMGMSADLESAIAAGSTVVRVGTALFGPRLD